DSGKPKNFKRDGELMGVYMIFVDVKLTLMPPTLNVNCFTTFRYRLNTDLYVSKETRAHKAQINAAVFVAGVDASVTAVAGATVVSSSFGKDEKMAKSEVAVATTLADALYMQADEVIGAKREHLALRSRDSQSRGNLQE
ncbi:unnamed protein product, partial [Brassica rapa]